MAVLTCNHIAHFIFSGRSVFSEIYFFEVASRLFNFCGLLNSIHLTWFRFTFAKFALSVLNLIAVENEEIIAEITKKKF